MLEIAGGILLAILILVFLPQIILLIVSLGLLGGGVLALMSGFYFLGDLEIKGIISVILMIVPMIVIFLVFRKLGNKLFLEYQGLSSEQKKPFLFKIFKFCFLGMIFNPLLFLATDKIVVYFFESKFKDIFGLIFGYVFVLEVFFYCAAVLCVFFMHSDLEFKKFFSKLKNYLAQHKLATIVVLVALFLILNYLSIVEATFVTLFSILMWALLTAIYCTIFASLFLPRSVVKSLPAGKEHLTKEPQIKTPEF
jgi:hypothetical protein